MSKISDEILRSIEIIVNNVAKHLDFDRTYTGIVSTINSDGYTVKYNGTEINIKTTATDVYNVNDVVKFCIPCGNKRKAYIVADLDLIIKIKN